MHEGKNNPEDWENEKAAGSPSLAGLTWQIKGDKDAFNGDKPYSVTSEAKYIEKPQHHWSTYVEAACAVLLVIITGVYTLDAGKQLDAMNNQLGEMKKAGQLTQQQIDFSHRQLEISERPWVSVKVNAGSELNLRPGGGVTLNFTLHNSGANPAVNAFFMPMPHFRVGTPNGNNEADELCKEFMPAGDAVGFGRSTIFPGTDSVSTTRIDFAANQPLPKFDKFLYPYIVGCVTYKAPFDPAVWRYSQVIAEMEELSSDGHGVPLKQGTVVPAKKLIFNDIFYNQKAN